MVRPTHRPLLGGQGAEYPFARSAQLQVGGERYPGLAFIGRPALPTASCTGSKESVSGPRRSAAVSGGPWEGCCQVSAGGDGGPGPGEGRLCGALGVGRLWEAR